jgi:hypothetical protein
LEAPAWACTKKATSTTVITAAAAGVRRGERRAGTDAR